MPPARPDVDVPLGVTSARRLSLWNPGMTSRVAGLQQPADAEQKSGLAVCPEQPQKEEVTARQSRRARRWASAGQPVFAVADSAPSATPHAGLRP
jgi:hypothetical protein